MKLFVLILFALTYVLIIAMPKHKPLITGVTALVCSVACAISGDMLWHEPFSHKEILFGTAR